MDNLLLEQYSRFKKQELQESPYRCLLDARIDKNPHQINAFIAAINSLKTGGIILADEVGLGKTIEAGLVLNYVLDEGAKRVLIVLPAALRKQWEQELLDKFGLNTRILDRLTVEHNYYDTKVWIEDKQEKRITITSYDYSSKLMKRFPDVKWDFIIIDEAHNLRNVFHGAQRAKNLYESSKGIPKILLTATPVQNYLRDIHALVSFIDPKIFGPEEVFNHRFIEGGNYDELKNELSPVLYRTLRKDVLKYMTFPKRTCRLFDFRLSIEETELYSLVDEFLKRKTLYSVPGNNGLIIMVIRKLLASSSYAVVETFEIFKGRLNKLSQGTRSADAQQGFDLFWNYLEDETGEMVLEETNDPDTEAQRQEIRTEMQAVDRIITAAKRITYNVKISALKKAVKAAFSQQDFSGTPRKVVIFTESKRTQKYIEEELLKDGYKEDDILLFNGEINDQKAKNIYKAWQAKNYGISNYGRSVEYKHAIVDYFKDNAEIMIVTDAGSEGLNLQFCNTVINYDLPWNPQKIEQRIGRCHRYGQKRDVVVINLLNSDNAADKRVYEILSKKFELFEGVFGASDVALGALESGEGFEKKVLDIYQKCYTVDEYEKAFNELDKSLDIKNDSKTSQLRNLLLTESPEAKGKALEDTKNRIEKYLYEVEYWDQFADPEMSGTTTYYWEIKNWGEENFGSHGTLFIGAFCDNNRLLFPVLLLCDENGEYINFDESDIVSALETARDEDIYYFKPSKEDSVMFNRIHARLSNEMLVRYRKSIEPLMTYNKRKNDNWVALRSEQIQTEIDELNNDIEKLITDEICAKNSYMKEDIIKQLTKKKLRLEKLEASFPEEKMKSRKQADMDIAEFNRSFDIKPLLLVNIVLKF